MLYLQLSMYHIIVTECYDILKLQKIIHCLESYPFTSCSHACKIVGVVGKSTYITLKNADGLTKHAVSSTKFHKTMNLEDHLQVTTYSDISPYITVINKWSSIQLVMTSTNVR
jgi:hypothetical protein